MAYYEFIKGTDRNGTLDKTMNVVMTDPFIISLLVSNSAGNLLFCKGENVVSTKFIWPQKAKNSGMALTWAI